MTVAFRVDASTEIGTGHMSRCLNLAKALAEREVSSIFLTRPHDGHCGEWIESCGFPVLYLPKLTTDFHSQSGIGHASWLGVEQEEDADATLKALGSTTLDWLVVDHYGIGATWERIAGTAATRLLVIDDLADREHDCDALIDQNAIATLERSYSSLVPARCLQLLGPPYALLGAEYGMLHTHTPKRGAHAKRVSVFFGGSDTHNLTLRTLHAINQLQIKEILFDVLVSNSSRDRTAVEEVANTMANVTLLPSQPSLAPLFAKSDLAIGAGGVSMWERCCLGLPSLVITVAGSVANSDTVSKIGLMYCQGQLR